MSRSAEYLISKAIGRRSGRHHPVQGRVMVTIATVAVALSVTVMVVTLSIIVGFRSEVKGRFTALSGDVIIASPYIPNPTTTRSILRSPVVEDLVVAVAAEEGVELRSVVPYAYRSAVLRTAEGIEGVVIKGVDARFDTSVMVDGLIDGEVPTFGADRQSRNAVVSRLLADEMSLEVGGRLELLVMDEQGEMRRDLYRVGAIYTAGLGEMERLLIFTELANIQRLNGWGEEHISGYDVSLAEGGVSLPRFTEAINRALLESGDDSLGSVAAHSVESLNPSIFEWLSALDLNAIVVITIMMVVAIFNIITVMLILVLEHSEMVGVLKTLGMNNVSLGRIFSLRSLSITLRGMLCGNVLALALLMVQRHFQLLTLDEGSYMLSSVPVDLSVGWWVLLNVSVVVVVAVAVAIPTRIVSRIDPCKAIKFQ